MILAGDIGGTKTLLGLYSLPTDPRQINHTPDVIVEREFPSGQYSSLEAVLDAFLKAVRPGHSESFSLSSAAFGIAGPVVHGVCQTTNLPWIVKTDSLAKFLNLQPSRVLLLNDLAAIAWGTTILEEKELIVLNEGLTDPTGTRLIVAPGTGLGESILIPSELGPVVLPTEGGHADWAPESSADIPLLTYLWTRFGHASCERIVSGQGFINLYHFYSQGLPKESLPLDPDLPEHDIPAAITHAALTRHDPLCTKILDDFCRYLGQEAGNMALKALPTGGVFLAGGIPGKIRSFLQNSSFIEHFTNKGRYRSLLSTIPVFIVDNPNVGIQGAWRVACQLISKPKESPI